jgi:hypothetical protein
MVHNVMVMIHTVVMVTRMCQLNMNFSLKSLNLPQTPDHNVMEWPQGAPIFRGPRNVQDRRHKKSQSEPAPTSAPTWMDGPLIGFSFPVPSQVDFFCLPFLFLQLYFLPAPHPVSFYLCFTFETFPTYLPPPLSPTDLVTYIFKLKVNSSPFTHSPIN